MLAGKWEMSFFPVGKTVFFSPLPRISKNKPKGFYGKKSEEFFILNGQNREQAAVYGNKNTLRI